jgi:hypothetical protein
MPQLLRGKDRQFPSPSLTCTDQLISCAGQDTISPLFPELVPLCFHLGEALSIFLAGNIGDRLRIKESQRGQGVTGGLAATFPRIEASIHPLFQTRDKAA